SKQLWYPMSAQKHTLALRCLRWKLSLLVTVPATLTYVAIAARTQAISIRK
ncbi:10743_t:CDS:1, partial [Funneliformis caledonium]